MKLFALYIGGSIENAMIEVHDVRIIVANSIEETYPELKAKWWGKPESLHLDCWGDLTSADGHNITLKSTPATGDNKVWFVNLGGYDPKEFAELHKNVFVVAPTESKAKVRALRMILDWKAHHKDYMFDVEKISCLNEVVAEKSLYIHLEATDTPAPFVFNYGYHPVGKRTAGSTTAAT